MPYFLGWISSFSVMPEVYFFGTRVSLFVCQKGNITFAAFIHIYRKYHISMYFLIKVTFFHFPFKEKIYFLEKRNTIFPDITKKIMFRREFFGKTIFSEHLKKISYFQVFFWEISSFLLCLKNKIIFSGKRNIIFPDNTRKIIFKCNFFGKTIFSKHLEKENMVFRAVRHDYVFSDTLPYY